MLHAIVPGRVEMFPFPSLTGSGDAPWDGIRRAMERADAIHFNMQGIIKENFQSWLRSGRYHHDPGPYEGGWTNRELYEVLTVEHLRAKTIFYGESGAIIDEPSDWLDIP